MLTFPPPVETLPPVEGISFKLSQRNTPPLWGDGLIDAIADTVIKEVADRQKKETPEVAGRVPRATGGGVGRFGWRGQTASLRVQTGGLRCRERPNSPNEDSHTRRNLMGRCIST